MVFRRYKFYFAVVLLMALAMVAMVIFEAPRTWMLGVAAATVVVVALAFMAVLKTLGAVQGGLYLIKEQDFSSRLLRTGQPDADTVVDLFNRLMDAMKHERLRTLELNGFLAKVLNASPMGIAVCDFDGNIVETNPAFLRLVSPQVSEALASLADDTSVTIRPQPAKILRCGRHWFMDSGFRRTFYVVELLSDEILDAEKQIFNKIIRTIGHEVNNTLGSVSSVLETLADIHAGEADVVAAVDSAADRCRNLAGFVRSYAEVVKVPEPVRAEVDFSMEIKAMMPALESLAPEGVEMRLKVPDKPVWLHVDMVLMERVMINIVKNAVESIGSRRPAFIEVALSPGGIITVTDNGPGISDEVAAGLFTPFFSTKRPDRGLGLMLVADILRAHGAAFSLGTDPATSLTTFSIRI